MLPFLNIFGVAIAFPPLVLIVGIWLGASLAEKHAPRHKISGETLFNLIFTGLAAYFVGGRLIYAIQNPAAFSENLLNLISRNAGLFDTWGGAAAALIATAIYGQRKGLKFWPTLDALTPAFAVILLAVPLANLASGEAYGAPSELPWAIELWSSYRHPVQLYEALGAAVILFLFWPGKPKAIFSGSVFLQFLAASALARLLFEGFRGNSLVFSSWNLRIGQVIAWVVMTGSLWLYFKYRRKVKGDHDE